MILISSFSDAKGSYASDIAAVEVLGGGVRMQVVQQAVIDVMGEVRTSLHCFPDTSLPLFHLFPSQLIIPFTQFTTGHYTGCQV
jgi:hypothetical protein